MLSRGGRHPSRPPFSPPFCSPQCSKLSSFSTGRGSDGEFFFFLLHFPKQNLFTLQLLPPWGYSGGSGAVSLLFVCLFDWLKRAAIVPQSHLLPGLCDPTLPSPNHTAHSNRSTSRWVSDSSDCVSAPRPLLPLKTWERLTFPSNKWLQFSTWSRNYKARKQISVCISGLSSGGKLHGSCR